MSDKLDQASINKRNLLMKGQISQCSKTNRNKNNSIEVVYSTLKVNNNPFTKDSTFFVSGFSSSTKWSENMLPLRQT